ncbi:MAG: GNAT family N-acetyltransferase [Spirochaetes bacterium]|nr:GNAT family N-acetyltransferase [Spirochaetota bacterium]
MLSIRKANHNDIPGIRKIHRACVKTLCKTRYTRDEIRAWLDSLTYEFYDRTYREGYFAVAHERGIVRGFGAASNDRRFITALYVIPPYNGRGIGARLLKRLETVIARAGVKTITVNASLNAVSFYANHGYRTERRYDLQLPDGTPLPYIRMKK